MEYLTNPFNISVNPYPEALWPTLLGHCAIYTAIYYLCIKLVNNHYDELRALDDYAFKVGNLKTIIENPSIPTDTIQFLFNRYLDPNSLDRAYLLHFIFEEKGDYEATIMNENGHLERITYNSWEQFKALERYFGKEKFNLDEHTPKDITVKIGDSVYNISSANLRFISWLYYSGLVAYLMDNEEIKYSILDTMNDKKLLRDNLFIRYQFYLIEYEKYLETILDKNDDSHELKENINEKENDNENDEINENAQIETEYNEDMSEDEDEYDKPDISDIDNMLNRYYVVGKLLDTAKELILGADF